MRRYVPLVCMALLMILVGTACSTARPASGLSEDEPQVRSVGEAAATTLIRNLMPRVQAAMQEGGPVYALDFCSVRAQPLTEEVNEQLRGVDIKRTSFKFRNPLNAPDTYEAAALRYFQNTLEEQGNLPQYYVQQIRSNEYRYYKPLVVGEACLNCHGDPAQFSPELQQTLNERYPNDRAVGFEEGDFRGVVRVTIPEAMVQ